MAGPWASTTMRLSRPHVIIRGGKPLISLIVLHPIGDFSSLTSLVALSSVQMAPGMLRDFQDPFSPDRYEYDPSTSSNGGSLESEGSNPEPIAIVGMGRPSPSHAASPRID